MDSCHRGVVAPSLLLLLLKLPPLILMLLLRIKSRLFAASVDFPVALFFKKCLLAGIAPAAVSSCNLPFASSLLKPPRTAALRMFLSIIVQIYVPRDNAGRKPNARISS